MKHSGMGGMGGCHTHTRSHTLAVAIWTCFFTQADLPRASSKAIKRHERVITSQKGTRNCLTDSWMSELKVWRVVNYIML